VVLPKGGNIANELSIAEAGIKLLGGSIVASENVKVPGLAEQRTVVIVRKLHPTPNIYPRRPGIPSKRPLAPDISP
ncbi:MAG: 16S rRNA (guanine(527)-N(7))-methyltransferase RsmG, partial [Chloroflexi bacterium]|nr:16S rRNA (guanine(527)-N(7))-methyltransferase RsmG [Chloroflexota bacterium]